MEVGWRWRKVTGMAFGLIVKWSVSGADTRRMLPSDSPIIQQPYGKLLVAVMNSYLCEVKTFYYEWELILEERSSL